ncbi:MAG: hydroxyacid dehydrogenase [Rhodospirillaceae bacterium]|jgi:D-3-phosphoglycerate dehydrogenase|nr:hydroxyacid dehydrogenase [Rhodospirillaceae bacterium]MBT3494628.1 hydroxyacid dehydrogenase [Rhodospirillaceae bacterium]MBT3780882.1 hydroxyacid dehydrogenase [Rhodospirillaceae bacterium]MBT3978917.1 hydroxyacid dehydrogenase [Rhodospirillaceae bacterium]MBT4167325.1 hydroxyacid dehydrogenase [Rhodospirillaceae bacterium]
MKKRVMLQLPYSDGLKAVFEGRDDIEVDHFTELGEDNIQQHIGNYDAVILGIAPLTPRLIEAADNLKIASRFGVGYDAVNVPALTKAGIPLSIAGIANSVTVAEHALFFMLALTKQALAYDRETRKGNWAIRFEEPAFDLAGRTVLIMGFGKIGRRLVNRCVAMEMNVLVHDPYVVQDGIRTAGATPIDDWRAILGEIDILSINCMKNEETTGMVNTAELAAMKKTAYVVNTARGGIVDEAALYEALKANSIAGAGIDPFVVEPATADTPLFELDNIIVSPHSAGVTKESVFRMGQIAAQNVIDCFDGKLDPANVINTEVLE